jgi:hypothetical protein
VIAQCEQDENVKVMRKAAETPRSSDVNDLKLNAGVPTLDPAEAAPEEKKSSRRSSLKGSVKARQGKPKIKYRARGCE